MEQVLNFVRELDGHNTKEWFTAHKDDYLKVQEKWYQFCADLIFQVGKFDSKISILTPKDCTYRIYRDTRFSKDKTPYKTHFGAFLAPGGKRSMHAGYYFHLGTGFSDSYPHAHMVAAGHYCCEPEVIRILREDIHYGWNEFSGPDVLGAAHPSFHVDMEGALKRVPRDYPIDSPAADWLRLRSYCLTAPIDESFILSSNLPERLAELFHTTKPFLDYINRAVDYARENN